MAYLLVDPDSVLSWQHDWTDYLAEGEAISDHQWSITPLNGTSPETPALSGDTTDTVFVSGLMRGRVYRLTERVTTDAGNIDDRTIVLRCEDR